MPNFNGMGPQSLGPRTGRGRGICGIGLHNLFGTKHSALSLFSIAVPAVTAVIIDVLKPDSITRRLYRAINGTLTGAPKKGRIVQ